MVMYVNFIPLILPGNIPSFPEPGNLTIPKQLGLIFDKFREPNKYLQKTTRPK